ncbi:hypothetical protein NQZ68_030897 [Dissostichus eleginoides]|nr:hypothetical protein NQZ68_030897 [Dissostichus eleginoides]
MTQWLRAPQQNNARDRSRSTMPLCTVERKHTGSRHRHEQHIKHIPKNGEARRTTLRSQASAARYQVLHHSLPGFRGRSLRHRVTPPALQRSVLRKNTKERTARPSLHTATKI